MSEGGDILLEIYDLDLMSDIKEDESSKQRIEDYLNQFDAAFTPGRGVRKLEKWKTNYPEQYRQFSQSYPSTRKNMNNWILGKNPEREQLLIFCIQSGFSDGEVKTANDLLYAFNYNGLHIRAPKDAIYYFALKNKSSWEETKEAITKLDRDSRSSSEQNKLSGKQTEKIKCTGDVQKSIDDKIKISSLDKLVEHIQAYPEDFELGLIKITARKDVVKALDELKKEKNFDLKDKDDRDYFLDPNTFNPDMWRSESSGRNRNIARWFCQSAGTYNKNEAKKSAKHKDKMFDLSAICNCSDSISRGEFIILKLFLLSQEWPDSIAEKAAIENTLLLDIDTPLCINYQLNRCGYDQLNKDRGVFDKIILDCIDASIQRGYPIENEYIFIDILNSFFEYLQKSGQHTMEI